MRREAVRISELQKAMGYVKTRKRGPAICSDCGICRGTEDVVG